MDERRAGAAGTELLTLDRATVRLGGRAVLRDLRLRIARGEVVAVTGSNGAGKTTLLRLAANLVRPATGRRVGRPTVAYVPAAIEPPTLRADTWLHGVRRHRVVEPAALLEQLGFDGQLDRPCRELSFGNLRKLLLADAFSSAAELVVVDEAGEGLDSRGAATLVTLMHDARTRARSVLFAEQQTQHLVGADRIVSLRAGCIDIDERADVGAIAVSFQGPAARLDELTLAAEELGYRYMVERE